MAGRLRHAAAAGLGDARTRILGVFLIVVAVLGTLLLRAFANFETVFVGLIGRRIRPKIVFRVKSVAFLTTISVPLTIAYDLWTASGEWYFITRPLGLTWDLMLKGQVPFTLYHVLSSLISVPLFGTAFLFLHAYGWPGRTEETTPARPMDRP